jgi:hypothetical protein
MERLIATHHLRGRQVDVVEVVDDNLTWFELVVDGEVVENDIVFDHQPTEAEIAEALDSLPTPDHTTSPKEGT